jgi:hypothetical protein
MPIHLAAPSSLPMRAPKDRSSERVQDLIALHLDHSELAVANGAATK